MELNSQEIVELITEVTSWQNRERKKREFELAQGAEGGLKPYVKSRVVELYPKTGHLYSISDYAVTKKVVNKKAKSYKEAPIRKLNETTEVGQAVYQEIAKSSGLNMVMSEFDKIYDPFFRASNTKNYEGYGIGLPLARNIIRIHNGELIINSKENVGTTVQISFPIFVT